MDLCLWPHPRILPLNTLASLQEKANYKSKHLQPLVSSNSIRLSLHDLEKACNSFQERCLYMQNITQSL